ncbi:MAG: hypothetical protein EOO19_09525 [Chryseobacterium sp.]|nr:MAG: hypothetical protein EOO19_09525 [Chryseobacterium sp.]
MINDDREEVLQKLALIDHVVFVGGTSEYLQGIKKELNDIDISISDANFLNEFGYVHKNFDNSFYGLSGHRGFIPLKNVLIDIFIEENLPNYVAIDGFKCETIESMISLRENTLKFNSSKLTEQSKNKILKNLNRLKLWKHLK